jgi:hypothetical protein
MLKTIIAIDPGKQGGVAVWSRGKIHAHALPESEAERLALLREIRDAATIEGLEPVCVLEQVGGYVGRGQPGSAMFRFGEGFGFLKGTLQTLGIPLELVPPQRWQKWFGLGTASRCASPREWKNKLKDEAQRRFPHLKVTHAIGDALLILEWALHRDNGAHGVTRPT